MADEISGPGRKLPPISPRPKNSGEDGAIKPVRKKKKKPVADTDAGSGTEDAKPTPRRRRRTPSASRDTDSEKVDETSTEPKPAPKKKKKKPKPKESPEEDEQPVSGRSAASATEDVTGSKASLITKESKEGTPRKKGKKKKVVKRTAKSGDDEYADSGFAADLTSIEDDIVKDDDIKEDIELPQTTNVGVLKSEPTQKIYVETISGFKKENRAKMAKRIAAEEAERQIAPQERSKTTIELALTTYHILKTFSLFIHGLTAGLAVWQVILVYTLSSFGDEDFLRHYQSLSLPVQCTAYMLLALCLVSACDRFDIGCINRRFMLRAFTLQNGAVSILFYLVAVTLSVTVVSTEDRMHLFYKSPDLWSSPEKTTEELTTWKAINTARGVFAVLGWVVLSITPKADRLSKNLKEGDDDDILGNDQGLSGVSAA